MPGPREEIAAQAHPGRAEGERDDVQRVSPHRRHAHALRHALRARGRPG